MRALAAGVNAATAAVTAAGAVVADSVATAVSDIRAATGQSAPANRTVQTQPSAHCDNGDRGEAPTTATKHATAARHLALGGQVDDQDTSPIPRIRRPRRRPSTTTSPAPRIRRPRRRPSTTTSPATAHSSARRPRRATGKPRRKRRQEGLGKTAPHCVEITRSVLVCGRGLQLRGGRGQQCGSVAGERGIDAFTVDHAAWSPWPCAPVLTTRRSQPSVYTAPAGPRSRTVTYQGIRSASMGAPSRSPITL